MRLNAIELSGGDKQKLMLTRAHYKDAPITTILDEHTAALDPITEQEINTRLMILSVKERPYTSVIVCHSAASAMISSYFSRENSSGEQPWSTDKGREGKYYELLNTQAHFHIY